MKPEVFGISTYFSMWGVAAVFGIWTGVRLARREGLDARRAFAALCLVTLAIVIGSKLLYLGEYFAFPDDDPLPLGQDNFAGALRHGFRIPGGLILLALTLPVMCRALRLPTWRFADAIMPAAGVAVVFIRLGCFLNGCCYGGLTDGPLGVSFPPGSRAYEFQLIHQQIGWTAEHARPMHPLQLYFAGLGLLMYLCARRWQDAPHFTGEVFLKTYALFFGGTLLLEFVRPAPLHLNLILTSTITVLALVGALRGRQMASTPASAAS